MLTSIGRLFGDRRGNFAIISALVATPLVIGVGVTLDLSTISRTKAKLQQAIDSAVLAVASEGQGVSDAKANDIAKQFIAGNFDPAVTNMVVTKVGTKFTVKAETKAGIAFGKLLGYDNMPVRVEASADIAYASYEIALVLDTTGSMAGGKLSPMKEAVLGLIDTMPMQVVDNEKLKFAVVPFASFVNVGPGFGPSFDVNGKQIANTGAPWLDLKGDSTETQVDLGPGASRFQIYENLGQKWPGCVETRPGAAGTSDLKADPSKEETLFVPAFGIDEPDEPEYANNYIVADVKAKDKSNSGKRKKFAKYGVATDITGKPLFGGLLSDVNNILVNLLGNSGPGNNNGKKLPKIAIDSGPSKQFGNPKGPGLGCEMQALTPLTNNYAALKQKVGELKANGYTNILEGVAWGMRVLSPELPFNEAKPAGSQVEKIMVVLTDGSNTFGNQTNELGSSYSSFGYLLDGNLGISSGGTSATTALMNAKTLEACQNAKAAGVELYTIRLEEPNVATGTMLKECASSPENYIDVPSRQQLDDAFKKIKEKIVRVRIAS